MQDSKPIPGVIESIHNLIVKHNKKILFYTNGGYCTRHSSWQEIYDLFKQVLDEDAFDKISSAISIECVYNTAYMTAKYLSEELKDYPDAKINVIGNQGLLEEIKTAGFKNAKLM